MRLLLNLKERCCWHIDTALSNAATVDGGGADADATAAAVTYPNERILSFKRFRGLHALNQFALQTDDIKIWMERELILNE